MRAILILMACVMSTPAAAFEFEDPFHDPPHYRSNHRKRVVRNTARVKGWEMREERRREPPSLTPPPSICMAPVMVSGLQGATERGAEEKARDAWAARVRTGLGERFMDLRFAAGIQKRCFRSSVGDNAFKSMRDKLKERMGMIDDGTQANDAMEYRCDLWAAPCESPWLKEGEDVKNAGVAQ